MFGLEQSAYEGPAYQENDVSKLLVFCFHLHLSYHCLETYVVLLLEVSKILYMPDCVKPKLHLEWDLAEHKKDEAMVVHQRKFVKDQLVKMCSQQAINERETNQEIISSRYIDLVIFKKICRCAIANV